MVVEEPKALSASAGMQTQRPGQIPRNTLASCSPLQQPVLFMVFFPSSPELPPHSGAVHWECLMCVGSLEHAERSIIEQPLHCTTEVTALPYHRRLLRGI